MFCLFVCLFVCLCFLQGWSSFVNNFNAKHFCIAENGTFDSTTNQSSTTNSTELVHIAIPVVLSLYPSRRFSGAIENISHITTAVEARTLGLKG